MDRVYMDRSGLHFEGTRRRIQALRQACDVALSEDSDIGIRILPDVAPLLNPNEIPIIVQIKE